jgi:hypothetical protein
MVVIHCNCKEAPINPIIRSTTHYYLHVYPLHVTISIYLSMALQPFVGPWQLFQYLDLFTQSEGLFRLGISPSHGRYLHTEQHKHRITHIDIHASSGIRNHDPSVCVGEDSSWAATVIGMCDRNIVL